MLFFFLNFFIFRNFIFLNQGKHPTLTPSFYPRDPIPQPLLPALQSWEGARWVTLARGLAPMTPTPWSGSYTPSLPQGTVGGAFELREVTFFLFPLGIFFM